MRQRNYVDFSNDCEYSLTFEACLSLSSGEFAKKVRNKRRSSHEKSHIHWRMAARRFMCDIFSPLIYKIKRALPPEDSQRKKYEKENCYLYKPGGCRSFSDIICSALSFLYLCISLADVYIIVKKCFQFVFGLLKKCEFMEEKNFYAIFVQYRQEK